MYPYLPFLRWMLAYGYNDPDIEGTLQQHGLHYELATISILLERLRADLVARGGKPLQTRVEGEPPRNKEGRPRPLPKKLFAKLFGEGMQDLSPVVNDTLLGKMETINQVRPMRLVLQVLLAKQVPLPEVQDILRRRFQMTLPEEVILAYQGWFWPVSMDYADVYLWARSLPEDDPDKEPLTVCLDRPLAWVFWRLSLETSMQWDEGAFFQQALQGMAKYINNATDPILNPKAHAPTQWVKCYAILSTLRDEWEDKNKTDQFEHLQEMLTDKVRMKIEPPRQVKALDEVQGEIVSTHYDTTPPEKDDDDPSDEEEEEEEEPTHEEVQG